MSYRFDKSGKLEPLTEEELAAADSLPPIIVFDSGTTGDGRNYWVYIAIKPSKYKEFIHATKVRTPIRLGDYGKVLKYGFEKEVPPSIKKEMEDKYGCRDNCLEELAKDIKNAQAAFLKDQEDKRINNIVMHLKNNQD